MAKKKQPIFPGTSRPDYRKIYGTADKLIKGQGYNTNIIDHIIRQCAASGLSKNQTAVLLSHALAESDFNPLKRSDAGFQGLWQFSKDQWNRFFSKDSSYQNQVKYLMTETAKTKDPAKYKGWIQVQDGGNGWVGKHKKTWDLSDNLEAINKAFSFGWERFGNSHAAENNFRYSIAQMFRNYVDTKNFGFNESNDTQNPNEYYMADNVWYEPENTLMLSQNTPTYPQDQYYENPTLKLYQQGGSINRDNILMVGDSWGVGMKKYFPNNLSVGSTGFFSRTGRPDLPSVAQQINSSSYSNGIIIVHSGGNDIAFRASGTNKKGVFDDVKSAVDAAKAKGNKIIFVAAPWMNHSSRKITDNRDKYNEWLREAALSLGAGYIDTNPIIDYMKQQQPKYGQFHLNNYEKYADYILSETKKLLSNTNTNTQPQNQTNNSSIKWRTERPKEQKNHASADPVYTRNNAIAMVNFLLSKGLPLHSALGVAGCIQGESGYNPYCVVANDNGGPSAGIAGWHDKHGKGNFTRLKQYAQKMGRPWTDIGLQADFLWYSLTEGSYKRKNLVEKLKNAKTLEDASFIWGDEYEVFKNHQYRNAPVHQVRMQKGRDLEKAYKELYGDNIPSASSDVSERRKVYNGDPGTTARNPRYNFGNSNVESDTEEPETTNETMTDDPYEDTSIYTTDYASTPSADIFTKNLYSNTNTQNLYNTYNGSVDSYGVPIVSNTQGNKYRVRDSKGKGYVDYYELVSNFLQNNPLRYQSGGSLDSSIFERIRSKEWPKPAALDYKDIVDKVWGISSNSSDPGVVFSGNDNSSGTVNFDDFLNPSSNISNYSYEKPSYTEFDPSNFKNKFYDFNNLRDMFGQDMEDAYGNGENIDIGKITEYSDYLLRDLGQYIIQRDKELDGSGDAYENIGRGLDKLIPDYNNSIDKYDLYTPYELYQGYKSNYTSLNQLENNLTEQGYNKLDIIVLMNYIIKNQGKVIPNIEGIDKTELSKDIQNLLYDLKEVNTQAIQERKPSNDSEGASQNTNNESTNESTSNESTDNESNDNESTDNESYADERYRNYDVSNVKRMPGVEKKTKISNDQSNNAPQQTESNIPFKTTYDVSDVDKMLGSNFATLKQQNKGYYNLDKLGIYDKYFMEDLVNYLLQTKELDPNNLGLADELYTLIINYKDGYSRLGKDTPTSYLNKHIDQYPTLKALKEQLIKYNYSDLDILLMFNFLTRNEGKKVIDVQGITNSKQAEELKKLINDYKRS